MQYELITTDARKAKVKRVPAKRLNARQKGGMGLHQWQIAWGLKTHTRWILGKVQD